MEILPYFLFSYILLEVYRDIEDTAAFMSSIGES